ncbi:sulfite exporter TauE/SafE family protein [Pelagibius litoralis]|uniref:Probable membrane transporter protein n=1 Tax=Pelagibius litoralis TaxID=374515 RepID=A0A967EXG9_9PROT|nr:sulfite exporter TauE/SafE family protein [Pelagibius litoralis]NIA69202.1 sulfite exporter TauE/SafE family protein [Pelagibius litoralis]
MIEWIAPAEVGTAAALFLIAISAATSFLTAAAGIGGGVVLIAVMAVLMPVHALIPVHGLVQIGSNAGRTAIMLRNVQWRVILLFSLGSLVGAAAGGLTAVQLPPAALNIGLGCFILWSVWGSAVSPPGRFRVVLSGVFSSFLTMFFGATGPFVSATIKTMKLGRLEHVATHAACMVAQHGIKVFAFGLLGFSYGPYAGLIVAMIASGFLGTLIGKHVLVKMTDENFHRVIAVLLSLLALRLLYEGLALLGLF